MSAPLTFKNRHVQHLRRLLGRRSARQAAGELVVEGGTLIGEALDAGWSAVAEFVAPGAAAVTSGTPVYGLAPGVIERVATTATPQPNLAVFALPAVATELTRADLVVVADGLGDPGNLGTILRSAEAAGANAVVVTPGSTDPFAPKVVRASAGAVFHVPVITATLDEIADAGLGLVGTSPHRGDDYRSFPWPRRVAIVLGAEAQGLPDEAPIDDWVAITHRGRAESLNVAMAATLLVFAASDHQRRFNQPGTSSTQTPST